MRTGTRTQVADTRRELSPRIFLDSLRTFNSSDECPSSFSDPAQGITFSASGAGNVLFFFTRLRISPATSPTVLLATAEISSRRTSNPD